MYDDIMNWLYDDDNEVERPVLKNSKLETRMTVWELVEWMDAFKGKECYDRILNGICQRRQQECYVMSPMLGDMPLHKMFTEIEWFLKIVK